MKRNGFKISIVALTILLLSGCVTYYPQVVDVPLINKKGDLRINGGYFLIPNINLQNDNTSSDENDNGDKSTNWLANAGMHGTISYGLSDILSLQGYASFDAIFRTYLQTALGVYNAFENKTVMEIYGGCGYGLNILNYTYPFSMDNDILRDNFFLPFFQFNIGKTDIGKKHIDYGIGLKSGYLLCQFDNHYNKIVVNSRNGWVIEPSIMFRFGSEKLKFNTMINYMWSKIIDEQFYLPLNVGMGINYTF